MGAPARQSDLADRLRAERRRRGLSQAQAAAEIGTTPQSWGRWEAGNEPQLRWREPLSRFLAPSASVSRLPGIARGPRERKTLTPLQQRTVEAALTRFHVGTALAAGEVAALKALFAAVDLEWPDGFG